jgi:AraC-like DNA-binding protein
MSWSRVSAFDDPLVLQAALQSLSDAEILAVERGPFRVEATQIGMNALRMQRFMAASPLVSTIVSASDRKSIAFLVEGNSSDLKCWGANVAPNEIVVCGDGALQQRSESNFRYGSMSVPMQDFPRLCETIVGREFLKDSSNLIVRLDPALMSRLLRLHKAVGQLAHDTPELLELPEVCRALEEKLVHAMIRGLAQAVGVEVSMGDRRHRAIIARFEDYLAEHADRPLYLTEICAGIGVAERTLRSACEERLGMGPIRYLTLRRMHLVRRALQRADASESTVTRIVTDHGFWELGRFSGAYRALFGELPSETLRAPAPPDIDPNRPTSLPTNAGDLLN